MCECPAWLYSASVTAEMPGWWNHDVEVNINT